MAGSCHASGWSIDQAYKSKMTDETLPLFDDTPTLDAIPMPDADVRFIRTFYRGAESQRLMSALQKEIAWRQETIVLWGKPYLQPRLSAWYGDAGSRYRYSGMTMEPHPWTPALQRIREDIEHASGQRYNSVLLNLYRNENDSIGWHSDDEPTLGPTPAIASLSLGDTRTFQFRHRTRKEQKRIAVELTDGSLLLMAGATQRYWQHAINKEKNARGPRINLTFRNIVQAA
jgi:alkylated DNA repair dioxygenase AlkB